MTVYDFGEEERVLLVGEAKFSFSVELLKYLRGRGRKSLRNLYFTCYEKEASSPSMVENILTLQESGAQVILGVDATQLSSYPVLADGFDHVVFNFPHVGGKMKIHLNRKLLADFFQSAQRVTSSVIVALCVGQGGTPADVQPRQYCDTWQVVEMAASGNFVLTATEPFPYQTFPAYISTGFRGGERSFRTEGGVVHVFSKGPPGLTNVADSKFLNSVLELCELPGGVKCFPLYAEKIVNNPLFRHNSPQFYAVEVLKKYLDLKEVHLECLPIYFDGPLSSHAICHVESVEYPMRRSLLEVHRNDTRAVHVGLVFRSPVEELSLPSVGCQALVVGMTDTFRSFTDNLDHEVLFHVEGEICILDLDALCMSLFKIESLKQLWTPSVCVDEAGNLRLSSLYPPPCFTFDICFSESHNFSKNHLPLLLRQVGESLIESVQLLNVYQPPPESPHSKSYCYRIMYRSHEFPLLRKRVIEFHQNIVGKALSCVFGVKIV